MQGVDKVSIFMLIDYIPTKWKIISGTLLKKHREDAYF